MSVVKVNRIQGENIKYTFYKADTFKDTIVVKDSSPTPQPVPMTGATIVMVFKENIDDTTEKLRLSIGSGITLVSVDGTDDGIRIQQILTLAIDNGFYEVNVTLASGYVFTVAYGEFEQKEEVRNL